MPDPTVDRQLYAALQALPETVVGEIIAGGLVTQPRPRHGLAVTTVLSTSPSCGWMTQRPDPRCRTPRLPHRGTGLSNARLISRMYFAAER